MRLRDVTGCDVTRTQALERPDGVRLVLVTLACVEAAPVVDGGHTRTLHNVRDLLVGIHLQTIDTKT